MFIASCFQFENLFTCKESFFWIGKFYVVQLHFSSLSSFLLTFSSYRCTFVCLKAVKQRSNFAIHWTDSRSIPVSTSISLRLKLVRGHSPKSKSGFQQCQYLYLIEKFVFFRCLVFQFFSGNSFSNFFLPYFFLNLYCFIQSLCSSVNDIVIISYVYTHRNADKQK